MNEKVLLSEIKDQVAVLTLNRPEKMNSLNFALLHALRDEIAAIRFNPVIRVVVITGAGEKAFCAGADLKERATLSPVQVKEFIFSIRDLFTSIEQLPKPVIVAVNGIALGGGTELALACDIRIAAEDAQIGSPEAQVTSSVTGGAMRLIQDLVGPGKAKELLFTAENIDGKEAERIGLVNKAVPADRLMPAAREMAAKIAANSAFSIKMIKKGLHMAKDVSLDALMDFEVEACLACVSTKERQTSLQTFEDRKKP